MTCNLSLDFNGFLTQTHVKSYAVVTRSISMVFLKKVSPQIRMYIKCNQNQPVKELMRMTGVSRRTIFTIKKEPLKDCLHQTSITKHAGGRPRKMSVQDLRRVIREVLRLRGTFPNWTAKQLMVETGIDNVNVRTVRRVLNQSGYNYLQTLKKGLMSATDRSKRVKFGKTMVKDYGTDVWTNDVAFYFDGVNFIYKRNPKGQALCPRGRVWRKKNEGLEPGCVAKGRKEGTGGKVLKLFVAISHDEGVICAEAYEKLNGENFATFVRQKFKEIFERSNKESRLWVQDGDPSQNSERAKRELQCIDAELLAIPPRSPDCNPIENIFKQVKDKLNEEAIRKNIQEETFTEFEVRVKETLINFPTQAINKVIESMGKRMYDLIRVKGRRLRY